MGLTVCSLCSIGVLKITKGNLWYAICYCDSQNESCVRDPRIVSHKELGQCLTTKEKVRVKEEI